LSILSSICHLILFTVFVCIKPVLLAPLFLLDLDQSH
jgi:hypothetical protein